jgi:transposase-like protein
MNKNITKESIIAEYLAGGTTYRKLSARYGFGFKTIQRWVSRYQGRMKKSPVKKIIEKAGEVTSPQALLTDVKQLQAELRKAQILNKVLNEMIDIAEQDLKVSIRKKSGTKRS